MNSVQHLTFPVDVTQTSSVACGFPITRHDEGVLVEDVRTTSSGTIIDAVHFDSWKITLTNPANGMSLQSTRGLTERDTIYPDGTDVHFEAGLVAHLIIPGQGEVATNVGHIVTVFDANGNLLGLTIDGDRDGPIAPYACSYLAGS